MSKKKLSIAELDTTRKCVDKLIQSGDSHVGVFDVGGIKSSLSRISHGVSMHDYTIISTSWKLKFCFYGYTGDRVNNKAPFYSSILFKGTARDFEQEISLMRLNC